MVMSLPSSKLLQDIRLIREMGLSLFSLLGPRERLFPGTLTLLWLLYFYDSNKKNWTVDCFTKSFERYDDPDTFLMSVPGEGGQNVRLWPHTVWLGRNFVAHMYFLVACRSLTERQRLLLPNFLFALIENSPSILLWCSGCTFQGQTLCNRPRVNSYWNRKEKESSGFTPLLNGPITKNCVQRSGILHIVRDP